MKKRPFFSHIKDNLPGMVDIGHKDTTVRSACAESLIIVPQNLFDLIEDKELNSPKGPVFTTAIIAGTMGVKNTSLLIPFCHPLLLSSIQIAIDPVPPNQLRVVCRVKNTGQTGVEMEALMGASIAALTIYDMCKSISSNLLIGETKLVQKSGGKHDFDEREN